MYNIDYNDDTGRYDIVSKFGSVIRDYSRRSDAVRGLNRLMNR